MTLTFDWVDWLYPNASVPRLQSKVGVVGFVRARARAIPSPALFRKMTKDFRTGLSKWRLQHGIP